ncbi:carbon storage regulator [Shewanella mangrovisoli]|nr:carbon storage regulator [Shewanella mangrovisoli]
MLIVQRYEYQSIMLQNIYDENGNHLPDIKITTLPGSRLGVLAASSVKILREELYDEELMRARFSE